VPIRIEPIPKKNNIGLQNILKKFNDVINLNQTKKNILLKIIPNKNKISYELKV